MSYFNIRFNQDSKKVARGEGRNLESVSSSSSSTSELEWLLARWAITPTTETNHAWEAHMLLPGPSEELCEVLSLPTVLQAAPRRIPCSQQEPHRGQGSREHDSHPHVFLPLWLSKQLPSVTCSRRQGQKASGLCDLSAPARWGGCAQNQVHDPQRQLLQSQTAGQPASAGTKQPPRWGEVTWLNTPLWTERMKSSPSEVHCESSCSSTDSSADGTRALLSRDVPGRCIVHTGTDRHVLVTQVPMPLCRQVPAPGERQLTSFALAQHKVTQL